MKKSLERSQFPNSWKIACVNELHKKGSYLERGNYRLISLLNLPGKLLEAVVWDVIDNHLLHNIRIDKKEQWAFIKGRSPELLMLHLTEIWEEALDKGKVVGILFIDFQKAFDSVCHQSLRLKMQACGISGTLYNLFRLIMQSQIFTM